MEQHLGDTFQLAPHQVKHLLQRQFGLIEVSGEHVSIERVGRLNKSFFASEGGSEVSKRSSETVVVNQYSGRLMERVMSALVNEEPVLLVGDTGCGKTTIVQHLASLFRKNLVVYNLSQGSDATDLLGGFRPINMKTLLIQQIQKYASALQHVVDAAKNRPFFTKVQ